MSVVKAIELINAIDNQPDLRMRLYHCSENKELNSNLASLGYLFNIDEFEDAVRILHSKCMDEEDANHLMNKAELLRFLLTANSA
jgi:hypothetical protein